MYRGVDFLREKHSATLNRRTMFSRINDFKGGVKTDIFFIFSKSYPGGGVEISKDKGRRQIKAPHHGLSPRTYTRGGGYFQKTKYGAPNDQ